MKVLMVIGLAMAVWAASGCGGSVGALAAAPPAAAYCFPAVVRAQDGRRMACCSDTAALCARSLRMAHRWASVAGILELGRCERLELR